MLFGLPSGDILFEIVLMPKVPVIVHFDQVILMKSRRVEKVYCSCVTLITWKLVPITRYYY